MSLNFHAPDHCQYLSLIEGMRCLTNGGSAPHVNWMGRINFKTMLGVKNWQVLFQVWEATSKIKMIFLL